MTDTSPQAELPGPDEAAPASSPEPVAPAETAPATELAMAEGTKAVTANGGEAEGAPDSSSESTAPAAGRKRRRKSKKKPDGVQAPLARFFHGAPGRRHAFAVGEVIAGRVARAEEGVIVIDLFGKATAFADQHEPREVPLPAPPEPIAEPKTPTDASAVATETAPAEEPQATAQAGASAEPESVAEAATDAAMDASTAADADTATDAAVPADAPSAEAESEADASDEADSEAHGPRSPLPVVPERHERLEPPALGHIVRGRVGAVAESGHIVVINRDVDVDEARATLERCRAERRRVLGLVFGYNRGGFDVLVGGLRAFCPARSMSLDPIESPDDFLGRELEFLIPVVQKLDKDVVIGRRSILEREQRKRAREVLRALSPGQRVKGKVTQVLDFGLVVDLGGAEGLVHQSELSWAHGVRPGDVAKPGDEIEVQVLRVGDAPGRPGGGRRERLPRLSLSLKALEADPWRALVEHLKEGSVQQGKVTRLTEFGAFVELAPAVEGLLHVSELGRDVKHAGDVLKEGETLPVVVERVDPGARRISLSKLSASEIEDWQQGKLDASDAPRQLKPGTRVKVRVEKTEHHGLLVRVAGAAGRRARGFIAKSDLGGGRDGDHRRAHPTGSEIEVKIVGFGRDGGLQCSVKALEFDDERRAVKDYRREAAKQGFGTFGDLLRAKLGEGAK